MRLVTHRVNALEEAVSKAEKDLDPGKFRKVFSSFPKLVSPQAGVQEGKILSYCRGKVKEQRQMFLQTGYLPSLSKPVNTLPRPAQNEGPVLFHCVCVFLHVCVIIEILFEYVITTSVSTTACLLELLHCVMYVFNHFCVDMENQA